MRALGMCVCIFVAAGCGNESRPVEPESTAGYRVAVPGPLIGRFPTDPNDLTSESFIAGAFGLVVDDSSIYVLDVLAGHVIGLDLDARPRSLMGRTGQGPGEFETPQSMRVGPDGDLWVSDPQLGRLSRFRPDGTHAADTGTPYPVINFAVLPGGSAIIPTMNSWTLLASLGEDGESTELAVTPEMVPQRLSQGGGDRFPLGAMTLDWVSSDTLLVFRNMAPGDFRAWRVAISPRADSIRDVSPLPLPEWLYTLIDEEDERLRRDMSPVFEAGTILVPFKSVRVVAGTVWLTPAPSARVIAVSLPRSPGDSASVVVPNGEMEGLLDAAVVGDRLVALFSTEVRVYHLERTEPDRFTPPG